MSGDDDESNANPLLKIRPRDGSDDDEPPAAGAVMVVNEEPEGPTLSMAPTGEPSHEVKPEALTV
ncbi:hypothetical protein M1M18_gp016 [Halorubrum virus Serpecor1]|uniref:Uncharacterized protein n=1 Tax=Halorubrum virus Serpecor1 TaxID=2721757 RepID=A0A6G9RZJ1_9CAUD|nr:hypothetical protein M1M18_gp016 [Halorubrum virus Serpecor1]QIR31284.1 hypothetical protein HrrSp1_615 [Halorubrum virus Serpecor1]